MTTYRESNKENPIPLLKGHLTTHCPEDSVSTNTSPTSSKETVPAWVLKNQSKFDPEHKEWVAEIVGKQNATLGKRMANCGVQKIRRNKHTGETTPFIMACDRQWYCFRCGGAYWTDARRRLTDVWNPWLKLGAGGLFITVTITHNRQQTLKSKMDTLTKIWGELTKSYPWEKIRKELDFVGGFRAIEITNGEQGLHPHVHGLQLVEQTPTDEMVADYRDRLNSRYGEIAKELGVGVPRVAVDFQYVDGTTTVEEWRASRGNPVSEKLADNIANAVNRGEFACFAEGLAGYVTKGSLDVVTGLAKAGNTARAENTLIDLREGTLGFPGACFSGTSWWGKPGYR